MKKGIVQEAIQKYGTPLYLFDLEKFRAVIQEVKYIMGEDVQLIYAMKANPFLTKAAVEELDAVEVCSPGEFAICERNGIEMNKIVLSGVYKNEQDIARVLEKYHGIGVYTVESKRQLELLQKEAHKRSRNIAVLLRLTSGNQFGIDETMIREIIKERERYGSLQIEGLQFYSGTQKKNPAVLEKEIQNLDILLSDLEQDYGYKAKKLEYGPGLFVSYFQKENYEKDEIIFLKKALETMEFQGKIALEMGRYLAATCGCYVTRIVDWKENSEQSYVIVDGGIHHLNYYGQTMAMKLPYFRQLDGETLQAKEFQATEINHVNVCGALCTVSDVLVKHMPLMKDYKNDVLAFYNTGAYSVTEGISLFLSRDFPKVAVWTEKNGLELKRDTIESNRFNG